MVERITSTSNPSVKGWARLKDRKGRAEAGRFLIEGHREITHAFSAATTIHEVVVAPELASPREIELAERMADVGTSVIEVGRAAFEKLSFRRHPDGLLAVASRSEPTLDDLVLGSPAFVLVLDGIEKPGNLGGIVRTADAAGVDAVILVNARCEPMNPNAIRASQGSVFAIPICVAPEPDVAAWIADRGLRTVAASPEATTAVWEVDLTGDVAVIIGAEANGVGPTFRSPGTTVQIPMVGAADSLNASVSAGILLFEIVRQRG